MMARRAPSDFALGRLPSIFHEMQREMDALSRGLGLGLFDDVLSMAPFRSPFFEDVRAAAAAAPLPAMRLATDVTEDDAAFTIKADVPGM